MMSTVLIVTLFVGLQVVSLALWAVFLRLGLGWAKVQGVTVRRVGAATLLVFVFQTAIWVGSLLISPINDAQAILLEVAVAVAAVLAACWVITRVFRTSLLRSLQAWLPTLIPAVGMFLLLLFVICPFVAEAFVSPTNAMAPTLLGYHRRGVCAECGRPAFCSPVPLQYGARDAPPMICGSGFHVTQGSEFDEREFSPDHFVVAKFLKPQRWDVVVFRYPEDPSVLYVMRLVGLPGEEIQIKDGDVWASGQRLTPPEFIRGITYLSEMPGFPMELWGTRDRPAKLSAGEYFVLGDFSAQSKDSRLWQEGSPGHAPYAVPESHLYGVVTHIFWPPSRWRILR